MKNGLAFHLFLLKRVGEIETRDPRLLHMKAMPVARSPNAMEMIFVIVVSRFSEIPTKQGS